MDSRFRYGRSVPATLKVSDCSRVAMASETSASCCAIHSPARYACRCSRARRSRASLVSSRCRATRATDSGVSHASAPTYVFARSAGTPSVQCFQTSSSCERRRASVLAASSATAGPSASRSGVREGKLATGADGTGWLAQAARRSARRTCGSRGRMKGRTVPSRAGMPNPSQWTAARARQLLQRAMRAQLEALGYQEVEPPLLVPAPGMEPHIRAFEVPFVPETDLGRARTLYLHTSPEYAMKRLLADGSGPISY